MDSGLCVWALPAGVVSDVELGVVGDELGVSAVRIPTHKRHTTTGSIWIERQRSADGTWPYNQLDQCRQVNQLLFCSRFPSLLSNPLPMCPRASRRQAEKPRTTRATRAEQPRRISLCLPWLHLGFCTLDWAGELVGVTGVDGVDGEMPRGEHAIRHCGRLRGEANVIGGRP